MPNSSYAYSYAGSRSSPIIKIRKSWAMIIRQILLLTTMIAIGIAGLSAYAEDAQQTGIASFYSYECAARPMANGKMFDPEKRTAASWFYDLGTALSITSLDTGLATKVIVTDRGPNKSLVREGRIIDLSKRAFEDICILKNGLTNVTIKVIGKEQAS